MANMAKKRSMRASSVSRQSLANLISNRSLTKSSSGSRTMGGLLDSRCYKHSPRVSQRKGTVGEELAIYEAQQWRSAFSAMGGLRKRGEKAPTPFTILNPAPYHCQCLAREFQVRYGELSKLQPPIFRKAKKMERPQICACIIKEVLPVVHDRKFLGPINVNEINTADRTMPRVKYYIPKSCVQVRWDPLTHSCVDKICEWLITSFGPFLFTTRTASNSMLVAFETMDQAYRAVNTRLQSSAKIFITWQDPAMFNFGTYTEAKDYTISTDPEWKRGMDEKAKLLSTRSTQPQLDSSAAPKPKQLKITESG